MKKSLTVVIMSAVLLMYSQLSHADDPQCFSACEDNYKKCVADVINNPEPRTLDEQQTIDACQQTSKECERSCIDTNTPPENPQKKDDGN